jgi:hypothetical protein
VNDPPTRQLSGDEIAMLTFAAQRQLTRSANSGNCNHASASSGRHSFALSAFLKTGHCDGCELVRDRRRVAAGGVVIDRCWSRLAGLVPVDPRQPLPANRPAARVPVPPAR